MTDFRMPSLGADMDAGTLLAWRVAVGDTVNRGDVVAEVETEKGIVEVEIWESGVVDSLEVLAGTKVPVGTVLAKLRAVEPAPRPELLPPPRPPAAPPSPAVPAAIPLQAPPAEPHVSASPAARQLARERGIRLTDVHGTGPHGAITRADVERASAPAAPQAKAPPAPPPFDATGMRRAIAAAMSRSKREIPHYYLSADLDVEHAATWLEAQNQTRGVTERILFAALLLKATALAVRAVPEVNGFFVDGAYQPSSSIHLGVAISLRQGGLVAPALRDVDGKCLADVQSELRDLVARARAGRLRSSEMSDPTLTVTNLGDLGVTSVFGVIYPPQVALVGLGRVGERAWASGGMLGVRRVVTATLSADHRVSDGHRGAAFLAALGKFLQEPEKL